MGEAAQALGVSVDTVRRWDRIGKIETFRDERNRRLVDESEIVRLSPAPQRHVTESSFSARNRFMSAPVPSRTTETLVPGCAAWKPPTTRSIDSWLLDE